jgi:glucosylceramidase
VKDRGLFSESMFKTKFFLLACAVGLISGGCNTDKPAMSSSSSDNISTEANYWVTTPDKSLLLGAMKADGNTAITASMPVIEIDTAQKFQPTDGFGFSLTGGSAMLINQKLSPQKRTETLKELFGKSENDISVSYLRVSIGASDLDEKVFTYCDGKADPELKRFSLREDEKNVIPVLKEILQINPDIKIMGSPWTAPPWMKDNNSFKGGSLLPKYYPAFANYFVKYIQGMEKHGIRIDAITIQNEPENPKNMPSMLMTANEQAEFIKKHLGPAFESNNIKTKIILFDHNCDHPEYPITILNDAEAKKYVDGSAFHLYLGEINALTKVHEAHPDRNIYFTEQWTSPEGTFGGDLIWHTVNLTVGASRNWSRNVLEWNLAADPKFDPHTDEGGCTMCQGALTIDTDTVTRNVSYYIIGHASKFISPGSVRIASTLPEGLANVAFRRPDGKIVVLVANEKNEARELGIRCAGKVAAINLPPGAVATVEL